MSLINYLNQFGAIFRFFNAINNVLLKLKNKKILIGKYAIIKNTQFESYNTLGDFVQIRNCKLGTNTYISSYALINNTEIGKFCSIGAGVKIGLGMHPSKDFVSTHPAFYSLRKQSGHTFIAVQKFEEQLPVKIGNDVWIGANTIIMDGLTIGDGAIIAAGAVVTENVAPYTIVGGVPAKLIRCRFDETQIEILTKLQWWNKDETWLKKNAEKFQHIDSMIQFISHQ